MVEIFHNLAIISIAFKTFQVSAGTMSYLDKVNKEHLKKKVFFPNLYRVLSGPFFHTLLDPQHQMNKPVDLNHPAFLPADLDLVQ